MSSIYPNITFHNVSLFAKTDYGVSNLSFKLFRHKKYRIHLNSKDQMNCFLGLLEGRYQTETGIVRKKDGLFVQSDRLLTGDKVISKTAEDYLGMGGGRFQFDGRHRSKLYFVDLLRAKSLLFYPVYKLKREDRLKFAILALLFQKSGLVLISDLLTREMSESVYDLFLEYLKKSHHTLVLVTHEENSQVYQEIDELMTSFELINLN